jgi:preprotein translocase subunit YajC
MLGLVVLLLSFAVTFYAPIAYFWFKLRQQRKQNK